MILFPLTYSFPVNGIYRLLINVSKPLLISFSEKEPKKSQISKRRKF